MSLRVFYVLDDPPPLRWTCFDHPAPLAAVLAGEHLHQVTLLHLHLRGHLENLRRERDDLHEVLLAKFARDRAEDARPARVGLRIDEDGGVLVETDERTVVSRVGLFRPND